MMRRVVFALGLACLISGYEGRLQLALEHALIDLVQRLHTQLNDKLDKINDDWNDKFDELNKGWNDKFVKLDKDWNDKLDMLKTDVTDLSDTFDRMQAALQNDNNDKFDRVQTNITDLGDKLDKLNDDWGDKLQTIENRVASFEKDSGYNLNRLEQNLTTLIKDNTLSTANILKNNLSDGIRLLQDRLESNIQKLSVNINKTSSDTRVCRANSVSGVDVLPVNEVNSTMTDVPNPRTCKKGVVSVPQEAWNPYAVIYPSEDDTPNVPYLCDTLTDGGGWIIIQRRTTGDVEFYRGWADYKEGFGTVDSDLWLGNENIHAITSQGAYELRVDLKYPGKSAFAHYETFALADEQNNYTLSVGSYDGTAGDSLSRHNRMPFSTYDRDNDDWTGDCAATYKGAWWYFGCYYSNLNGKWEEKGAEGARWNTLTVSHSEMKIRRVDN